jgi:hypothetical protein
MVARHVSHPVAFQAEGSRRRWSRVRVTSSHVERGWGAGQLEIGFAFESSENGSARRDEIFFETPPDFRAHPDSVAAAVMTLLSTTVGAVTFNFPISTHCADTLRSYYRLDDLGPVDASLEPRRPGSQVGLNFSGGMDSRAAKSILDELLPGAYRLVTTDYGGFFAHERIGFTPYAPDVVCRTDFRGKRFAHGRFNGAVPLLFADYLDLEWLATGHSYAQDPQSIEPLLDGTPPNFRELEAAFAAGGLREMHLVRGMNEAGLVKTIRRLPDEQLEWALNASSPPTGSKYLTRGTILRRLLEEEAQPVPAFLPQPVFPPRDSRFGAGLGGSLNALWLARRLGVQQVRAFWPGVERVPAAWFASLTIDFLTKYNPNHLGLLPPSLRGPLLTALSRRGVEPYTERDWRELGEVLAYLLPLQERLNRRRLHVRSPTTPADAPYAAEPAP